MFRTTKNLKIKRGLDLSVEGSPSRDLSPVSKTSKIALDISFNPHLKAHLLVQVGDMVALGQPVVEDKTCQGLVFVAPTSGKVLEIQRGVKRSLSTIVFASDESIKPQKCDPPPAEAWSREALLDFFKSTGLMAYIQKRPFGLMANPHEAPRSIFVKAIESAPFLPKAEKQLEGKKKEFEIGLKVLRHLTDGKIYLICHKKSEESCFKEAKDVELRTVEGPHPISSPSIHIQWLDPIQTHNDVIWTIDVQGVIAIGSLVGFGKMVTEKWVSIAGPLVAPDARGYRKVHCGSHMAELLSASLLEKDHLRVVSGDPLRGTSVGLEGFLGFHDLGISVFSDKTHREPLHFMQLGRNKYTTTRTYLSKLFKKKGGFSFTTKLHGEKRPFIDGAIYDRVMPLRVAVMPLIKAILAEDLEEAKRLGLLEITEEDLALPAFICPSKIELMEILLEGQQKYREQMMG